MQEKSDKRERKRTYEKPKLRIIELATEEVLAVGCKLAIGSGNVAVPNSCTLNNCVVAGS